MRRFANIIFLTAVGAMQLTSMGCDLYPEADETRREEPTAFEKAREVEAGKYAPDAYEDAVAGENEKLARRAVSEAIRVRDEAKIAAEARIRDAEVLLEVVKKVKSNDGDYEDLPTYEELAKFEEALVRARRAFEDGDFPTAGTTAQLVTQQLGGSVS